jgi:tetratricopeptide (TPR) repeat protein
MIIATALALLLASATPDPLDEARVAFAAGDYARAERLALGAAEPQPEALYLAGLARFRAGRPGEALELLDRAEAGADSPAAWHFNRAACLYQLQRNAEAEAEFLRAADDPAFAALALVNAGFASLDGGETGRAAALAERARGVATGSALALVEELEQAVKGAPVPAVEPAAGPVPAILPLPATWTIDAHLECGVDSDPLRASGGTLERPGQSSGASSPLLAASAGVAWRGPALGATAQASYAFQQLAYLTTEAEDRSEQQHDLALALRVAPLTQLQLELALFGQYALAGLSDFRPLQAAAGARLAGAWDLTAWQTGRIGFTFTAKDGIGTEFASLDGERWEGDASYEARWERVLVQGGYRLRLEQIGAVTSQLPSVPAGSLFCPLGCTLADNEPLGYRGQTGWLSARLSWPRFWLDLLGGVEGRLYDESMYTTYTLPDGSAIVAGLRQRNERRLFTSETATYRLNGWLAFTLRHDFLTSRSTLQPVEGGAACAPAMPACRPPGKAENWSKQVLTVGASGTW